MDGSLTFLLIAVREESLRQRLNTLLRPHGFALLEATSAKEVFRLASAAHLILLTGEFISLSATLKADAAFAEIPVLVLGEACENSNAHLPRPFAPGVLLDTIHKLLADRSRVNQPSLALFRGLIDGLSAHVAIVDTSGTILAVNESWRDFARQNGGDPNRLCEGANYLCVCEKACQSDPEGADFTGQLRKVLAGELQSFHHEYPCHATSEPRWFGARVTRVRGSGGCYILVAHENRTDRTRVENALAESQEHLTDILDSIEDGFIALEDNRKVRFVNEAAARLLGRPRDQILGRCLESVFPELKSYLEQVDQQRGNLHLESHLSRSGVWVELHLHTTRTGHLLYMREITALRQARESVNRLRSSRLEELEREASELQLLIAAPRNRAGSVPLRESAPELFKEWVNRYEEALELALEQRAYRVNNYLSERLRQLADRLGYARAGPRDVVEVHTAAIQGRMHPSTASRAQAYAEEGRLLLVELMGNLVSYYRAASLEGRQSQP